MKDSDKIFTKDEFVNFVNDVITSKCPLGIREGQMLMIKLWEHNKHIYNELTGTDNDCFYNCVKIIKTLKYISEHFVDHTNKNVILFNG